MHHLLSWQDLEQFTITNPHGVTSKAKLRQKFLLLKLLMKVGCCMWIAIETLKININSKKKCETIPIWLFRCAKGKHFDREQESKHRTKLWIRSETTGRKRNCQGWVIQFWFKDILASMKILVINLCADHVISTGCRMTNLVLNFECFVLIFFQPTLKSDLKEVQFTLNYLFWVKAPL